MLSCGHVHTRGYCEAIVKRDDCRLVAVWDDMGERGQRFARDYAAVFCDDLPAAIQRDDVHGLIICAENTRHLPLLRQAIPAGKPVFCEKPFTTTVAEAREAMELIRRHDATVMMGYFQPFSATMQGVAGLLAAGTLGRVTHARFRNAHHAAYGRWFGSPENAWFADPALAGGGAFMDMGTHAVHALRTLLGPAERAWATIGNASGVYPNVDDCGIALVELANGALATVEASWVQTGGPRGLEITGSKATLYSDPQRGYVYAGPKQEPQAVPPGEPRPDRVDRLVAAIEGGLSAQELADDLACAADAVAIMAACYESGRTGGWVDVPEI
jgi:predicted dehydrogenase